LSVPREKFEKQVELFRRLARIVPLRTLLEEQRARRDSRGLVAVTFDDAYASLLPSADFLRSEDVPVTVFAVAAATERGAAFWWDRVEDLFPVVARDRWRRFEDEVGLPDRYRKGQPASYGPLRPLRQWVLATHRGRWSGELEGPLAELEQEVGLRTVQRAMSWEELRELSATAPVEIGVHTMTHPVLPFLSKTEVEEEVGGAWEVIRTRLPRAIPVLAIPYGLYDAETVRCARAAGMIAALSVERRSLREAEVGALPRYCVTSREAKWKLAIRLTGLADALRSWRRGDEESYPPLPSPTT